MVLTDKPDEQTRWRSAPDILTLAAEIVAGDRNTTHGEKKPSFQTIADLWNAFLGQNLMNEITPSEVAVMMVLLKIGRTAHGTHSADHYLDMAGYAAIAGELA